MKLRIIVLTCALFLASCGNGNGINMNKKYYTNADYVISQDKSKVERAFEYAAVGDKAAFDRLVASPDVVLSKKGVKIYVTQIKGSYVKFRIVGSTNEFWSSRKIVGKQITE